MNRFITQLDGEGTLKPSSVVQLERTSSIMRVVMNLSPNCSKMFLFFHITYDSCLVKWFGAHYNKEVRLSSAVKWKNKGPQALTSLLIIIISRD